MSAEPCSFPVLPDKGWQRGGFKHNEVGILGCYGDYVHEGRMQSRCYDGQWKSGFSQHICYGEGDWVGVGVSI